MAKLIKRKNNWYLIDAGLDRTPQEGSPVIYADSVPAFAKFIDQEEKTCFLSEGLGEASFDEFEVIIASTNPSDTTPMLNVEMIENQLLKNFIFDTLETNFGVNYPDEHDSVMGYYPTKEECIAALREWFSRKPFPILVRDMYYATYTIHVPNKVPEPYLIDGFVNILKVNIKAE
jgi:hypothetical protein